ncbi:hypothetical protein BGW37DRAFT_190492 [Umbelopsis sp. PMI_123]|nr:hypothetical protein BGW37DRAFT_190492 [Umbelopsis sp. PMI_123]
MSNAEVTPLATHSLGLELRSHPQRGRGVFTTRPLSHKTLVDISPVLLMGHDEYSAHGQHTILDHYTYRWEGGYALALGLGSMFNHAGNPNVGFIRDIPNAVIRYFTLRPIETGEELCISYGDHLWFEDTDVHTEDEKLSSSEDEWFGKVMLESDDDNSTQL